MPARPPAASPLVTRRRHDSVSAPDGYTRTARFAQRGDVVVDRAVDPITGLPVLVYRFPGEPVAGASAIDTDDVWKVLEHGVDERGGYLVTDVIDGATSIEVRPASLDDHGAERAFAVVAAAAARGVVHGDLGAHRLYRRGSDVWIEGYGVPWAAVAAPGATAAATPQDDARALARSLLAQHGHALGHSAVAALRRASEDGDAAAAAESLRVLDAKERDDAAESPPPDAPADSVAPAAPDVAHDEGAAGRPQRNAASAEFDRVRVGGVPEADVAAARSGTEIPTPYVAPDYPGPSPLRAAPDVGAAVTAGSAATAGTPARPERTRVDAGPRFSKEPPPDVTYRSGAFAPPERAGPARVAAVVASVRDRRRVWLLGLLVVAAMALALVTVMGREASPAGETIGSGGSYVVDVRVAPASLPPVSLVIVASPPGSRHAAGTVIRTVPDKVVLDRDGTWQLQGRFDGRHSQIVTIAVPRDQLVVLPFTDTP